MKHEMVSSNDEEYFAAMSGEKVGEDSYLQMALEPYQDEPLASSSDEEEDNGVAEADINGLPLETLMARFNPISTGRFFTHFVLGGGVFRPPHFFFQITRDITIRLTPIVL